MIADTHRLFSFFLFCCSFECAKRLSLGCQHCRYQPLIMSEAVWRKAVRADLVYGLLCMLRVNATYSNIVT